MGVPPIRSAPMAGETPAPLSDRGYARCVLYLAVDLGGKRTGLAVGDDETGIATPLEVIEVASGDRGALVERIAKVVGEHRPGAIVVGLPLNMDDSEGPAAAEARAFGALLGERVGLPVHYQDERLTSVDADWSMGRTGLTHKQKKARRDAIAASVILGDFLRGLGG